MNEIKAIETRYAGYRFRSRTEARWAVFFDALGISYEYEKEGYVVNTDFSQWQPDQAKTRMYLPDFFLQQVQMFAEVKGGAFSKGKITIAFALQRLTGRKVLLLDGTPDFKFYLAAIGSEFNHGSWDFVFDRYELAEGHEYWKCEHRFYNEGSPLYCGYDEDDIPPKDWAISVDGNLWGPAISAARSARFEHGETP